MIFVRCYRLYINARGFEDYSPAHDMDREFETSEKAVAWMDDVCGRNSIGTTYAFDVEVVE